MYVNDAHIIVVDGRKQFVVKWEKEEELKIFFKVAVD